MNSMPCGKGEHHVEIPPDHEAELAIVARQLNPRIHDESTRRYIHEFDLVKIEEAMEGE